MRCGLLARQQSVSTQEDIALIDTNVLSLFQGMCPIFSAR